jgi:hypothetical protein
MTSSADRAADLLTDGQERATLRLSTAGKQRQERATMAISEPARTKHVNRTAGHEGAPTEHPVVRAALRALNLVAGTIVALVALVAVGAYASLQNCEGGETQGLCVAHAGLVPVLEWPIFVVAVLAPFLGGIAAFARRQPRWLAVGTAVAIAMFGLMSIVSTGQTPYDWN